MTIIKTIEEKNPQWEKDRNPYFDIYPYQTEEELFSL